MTIFSNQFSTNQNFQPFIFSKHLGNIRIIPYVQNRLNFAHLVVQTVDKENINLILVDLPDFLGTSDWLDQMVRNFPFIYTLYLQKGKSYYHYTYSPSDAAYIGLFLAKLRKIEYMCIDDPNLLQYAQNTLFTPNLTLKDDQFVFTEGMQNYFKNVWKQLNNIWWLDRKTDKYASLYRASVIAKKLLEQSQNNKNILFICEYRLWWLIQNILEKKFQFINFHDEFYSAQKVSGTFTFESPSLLWIKGIIDDYPYITYLFYEKVRNSRNNFKGKLKHLDQILSDFFNEIIKESIENVSVKKMIIFKRYLSNLLVLNQRLIPLPANHLLHSAEAIFKNRIAQKLADKILSYPYKESLNHELLSNFFIIDSNGLKETSHKFNLPDLFTTPPLFGLNMYSSDITKNQAWESMEDRKYWVDQIKIYLTHSEENLIYNETSSDTWATSYDKRLRYYASLYIKDYFTKNASTYKKRISYGNLKNGIDWKATMVEFSKGFSNFIIKEKKINNIDKWAEYCPIVFIFSERENNESFRTGAEGNITDKLMTLGINVFHDQYYPPPDAIYTMVRSIKKMKYILNNHIRVELLSALGVTFTSRYIWVQRYQELIRRNPKYLCRLSFDQDNELAPFEGHEKIIAWAIKYAKDVILILSYPGWKPLTAIINYANQKKVRLMIKSIHILPERLIKRLKINFYISNNLKKSPYGEEIMKRYIRKMGFKI